MEWLEIKVWLLVCVCVWVGGVGVCLERWVGRVGGCVCVDEWGVDGVEMRVKGEGGMVFDNFFL